MFYTYNNCKLHYHCVGNGKPFFMLHGLACDSSLMQGCMEPLFESTDEYQRIYIDLPGMGQSCSALEFASSDKILEVILSFIDYITDGSFLIAGESYGGYLARGVLAKLASRIDGMLLLCPVVYPHFEDRTVCEINFKQVDANFIASLPRANKDSFLEYAAIATEYTYTRYQNEILSGIALANEDFINILRQNYGFSFDVDTKIQGIHYTKPVLLLSGRQDNSVGYEDLQNLSKHYPRATFLALDLAGHNLQIEQPEVFNTLAKNWLRKTELEAQTLSI